MLTGDLLTMLELARAEAKRDGLHQSNPLALARVLARRQPEIFEQTFGAGACEFVRNASIKPEVDISTDEILNGAADGGAAVLTSRLRDKLGGELTSWLMSTPARASQPRASFRVEEPDGQPSLSLLEIIRPAELAGVQNEVVAEVLAQLSRRYPGHPLITGASGSGRTTIAGILAQAIDQSTVPSLTGRRVVRLSIERLLREPANFGKALVGVGERDIAFIDDVEALLALSRGIFQEAALRLRATLEQPTQLTITVIDEGYLARLEAADEDLFQEFIQIPMQTLSRDQTISIATQRAAELASHHGVELSPELVELSAAPPPLDSTRVHPGLAIDRLDTACARASMRHSTVVDERDIGLHNHPETAPLNTEDLLATISDQVRGQDAALQRITQRLALTRAKLDLRPERPDAVLLLVGPTGVGKTQLARSLASALFGSEDRLIRLDMSEYADEWSISRLIGPQPGYAGYGEPDSWLTTRIRQRPQSVLLLDEIEKAHPDVWNTFLQVFDAGRLTDPRGNVASFADTVILMTSNIGAETFSGKAFGFADQSVHGVADQDRDVLAAVRATMRPELLNRLDDIIVFRPLTQGAILDIARREIENMVIQLQDRGYRLEVDPDVPALVAKSGYDPEYGARHLQRNVERLLLMPLTASSGRALRAKVDGDAVVWITA